MVFLSSFVRDCHEVALLDAFSAVLGEFPPPAWPVVSANAIPIDTVDVSCPFEFDHAAS